MALVMNGQLADTRNHDSQLWYQLHDEVTGKPLSRSFNYKGEAHISPDRRSIVLGSLQAVDIYRYRIGPATPESIESQKGYNHGMDQKRRRIGRNWSDNFTNGWRYAWEDKDAARKAMGK